MWLVHPFRLIACLLLPLALAAPLARRHRLAVAGAAVLALAGGEALLLLDDAAAFNDFKAIYAPLHVPNSRTLATIYSPRGLYMLLDDFTERVDTDVSNNAAQLGLPGPPLALGLYRDGNRIAALPKPGKLDVAYAGATLGALPYALLTRPRVLLAGASGGFRAAEALALGAATVAASEPEPVLRAAIRRGLAGSAPLGARPRIRLRAAGPLALARAGAGRYDLVDISGDFLDAAPANATAFTKQAITADLRAVAPDGLVSIPVSIREFPAYASRMLATVRAGLLDAGVADPGRDVLVYRSAWNVRILVSPAPLERRARSPPPARGATRAASTCHTIPASTSIAARKDIYNDLPAVSFEAGQVTCRATARTTPSPTRPARCWPDNPPTSSRSFDLSPITLDRPAFYAVLKLSGLGTILRRLELLPQQEVGPLVNLAVLAQAAVIAAIVLLVPLLAARRVRLPRPRRGRSHGLGDRLFRGTRPGLPVHRDRRHRARQRLSRRPHQRLRPGADRNADLLRPRRAAGRPAGRRGTSRDGGGEQRRGGVVRADAGAAATGAAGQPVLALGPARRAGAAGGGAGLRGARPAVPAGARAAWPPHPASCPGPGG